MENQNLLAGIIVFVDLSTGACQEKELKQYWKWIGGRLLGSYLLSNSKTLHSNNPSEQPIIIVPGLLVGSGYPAANRSTVIARNQISGGFLYSSVGGDFGHRMKLAGYAGIVIEGASHKPVVIEMTEKGVRIQSAEELWNLNIPEFQKRLLEKKHSKSLSFLGIGRAGENEVKISCLIADTGHAAGWGGSGAIFGAKKLKAIIVDGQKPLINIHQGRVKAKTAQLLRRMHSSELLANLIRLGTHGVSGSGGITKNGPVGAYNLRDEYLPMEKLEPIREEKFRKWETGRGGCYDCPVNCLHKYKIPSKEYGLIEGEGMHTNSVRGFGNNLGLTDPEALFKIHTLCNEYGMNVDGVSSSMAFILECAENELLPIDQGNGIQLRWGDGKSIVKVVEQIGENKGIGKLLAKGTYEASKEIGAASQPFAMITKKVGINEQGLRSHRAWALGIMVSNRGGGHLGGPMTEYLKMSPEVGSNLYGIPTAGNPDVYEGKGKLVAVTECYKVIVDSLGLCYNIYGWNEPSIGGYDELSEMIHLSTGRMIHPENLRLKGLMGHTLERCLSYSLSGFDRKDDRLPERFFDTPVSDGPYKGKHLDHEMVEETLSEYYETLGWDVQTGLPNREQFRKLGIPYSPS